MITPVPCSVHLRSRTEAGMTYWVNRGVAVANFPASERLVYWGTGTDLDGQAFHMGTVITWSL